MTDKLPVYGFLGSGDSADQNIASQLDNFMPQDVGDLLAPKTAGPGVVKIVQWIEDAFSVDVERPADVIASLAVRKAGGEAVTLIMVLDEPYDEADAILALAAIQEGIVVRSINHAMDEVSREDVTPEQPVSEPEQPAEPRTASRRRTRTPAAPNAAETVSEPQTPKRRGRPRTAAAAAEAPAGEVAVTASPAGALSVDNGPAFWQGTTAELIALIDARVALSLRSAVDLLDPPPF